MDGRSLDDVGCLQVWGNLFIGTMIGLEATGTMSFRLQNETGSRTTRSSIVRLSQNDIGSDVVVGFIGGADGDAIILGKLAQTLPDGGEQALEITAERELTLRCGKASITLTREGKVILRGTYISSRSSGANRIKGGSVQIN